jgi:hypothetical protein
MFTRQPKAISAKRPDGTSVDDGRGGTFFYNTTRITVATVRSTDINGGAAYVLIRQSRSVGGCRHH